MNYLRFLAATFFLTAGIAAHADTLKTFNLSGSEKPGSATMSGTITIDITKGFVVSDKFVVDGKSESGVKYATQQRSDYAFYTTQGDLMKIMVGSLVNFTGGAFTLSNGCTGYVGDITGQTNPVPTPEPTSIALLGTGLVGIAGAMRRRIKPRA